MSTYEVLDLVLTISDSLDSIFNYWISVTLAVIGGTFVARRHLTRGLVWTIGTVYAAASAMFALRFYVNGRLLATAVKDASDLPGGLGVGPAGALLGPLRLGVFLLGMVMTLWFVSYTYGRRDEP